MFDPNKPYARRDGVKTRILGEYNSNGQTKLAVAHFYPADGTVRLKDTEVVLTHTMNGAWIGRDTGNDLVNTPPVRTSTYQNVYDRFVGGTSDSRESADAAAATTAVAATRLGVLRRDFDDGVFVGVELILINT